MSQGGSDAYQTLPYFSPVLQDPLVFLDWSTNHYHVSNLGQGRWPTAFTNHYHRIEGLGMTDDYIGLELVVGGAVDEGDAMLFFIG